MSVFDDLLPSLLDDETVISEFHEGATTTLLILPVELLHIIAGHLKFSDVVSLSTVCKYLYSICLHRLYSLVFLSGSKITLPPMRILPSDAPATEILPYLNCNHSAILRGLLQQPAHLTVLRTLICKFPWKMGTDYDHRRALICTLVRYIILVAPNLQYFSFSSAIPDATLDLEGVIWPLSLKSLEIGYLDERLVGSIGSIKGLESFSIEYCAQFSDIGLLPTAFGRSVRTLRYTWGNRLKFGEEEGPVTKELKRFPQVLQKIMPNLEKLSIGVFPGCGLRNSDDATLSLASEVRKCFLGIVSRLSQLQELTITSFRDTFTRVGSFEDEKKLMHELGAACPTLRRISLQKCDNIYNGSWQLPITVVWKRSNQAEVKLSTPSLDAWTPDPTICSRWEIWFREFGTVEEVERMMRRYWGKERYIPR
ncbi:hypothetical protein FRC17_007167, partial [Serendipita sp. 399]